MPWSPSLTQLRDALVEMYPDSVDARRVVSDALLPIDQINLDGKAVNVWQSILEEAEKRRKVMDIVTLALRQYPQCAPLHAAVVAYALHLQRQLQRLDLAHLHSDASVAGVEREMRSFYMDMTTDAAVPPPQKASLNPSPTQEKGEIAVPPEDPISVHSYALRQAKRMHDGRNHLWQWIRGLIISLVPLYILWFLVIVVLNPSDPYIFELAAVNAAVLVLFSLPVVFLIWAWFYFRPHLLLRRYVCRLSDEDALLELQRMIPQNQELRTAEKSYIDRIITGRLDHLQEDPRTKQ